MAIKRVDIPGVGLVTLQKHARSRHLRITVGADGQIRVTIPRWTPYAAGAAFARANALWIAKEQGVRAPKLLENGQRIGKQHYVRFEHVFSGGSTTRVTKNEVIIRLSGPETTDMAAIQSKARAAAVRALKNEANELLPPRLAKLAATHGLSYSGVDIKSLKRRWGSCNSEKHITLNLYLMELPWEFIDYVLLHELTHTEKLHHGPDFWKFLTRLEPSARAISKRLHTYQPQIGQPADIDLVA